MKRIREIERLLDRTEKKLQSLCDTTSHLCAALQRAAQLGQELPSAEGLLERADLAGRLSANMGRIAKRD